MVPNPSLIYHITPVENLRAILQMGELRAKHSLDKECADYTSIAHQSIQDRRANTHVPCGPKGVLHDYVPFYFGPRSPMLYTISKGNVDGFVGDQQSIVHLVSNAQAVQSAGLSFVFTDGHGIMALTDYYDDLGQLTEVDWPLMNARYWNDTIDDSDRKRRRQAEFLVHQRFPVSLIQEIGVINQTVKLTTEALLTEFRLSIAVIAKPGWYY